MSMDERLAAFINGESLAVEAGAIETELAQLWKSAAAQDYGRACTSTLLVYSPHEGAYESAVHALAELTRRHSCRIVAMIAAPEADENESSAYLSAYFHDAGGKKMGCEQITFVARGNTVDQLAEMAAPLLVEKLPVALWWQGDLPEENVLFEKLLSTCGHLIFDSADGRDVGNTLSQARALSLHWKNGIGGDLNWLRLAPWRNLIARFMESELAASLRNQLAEVALEVSAAPEGDVHFAKPFLLLGWLANLLSWKLNEPLTPAGENVFLTNWQNKDKEVAGKIALRKSEADSRAMLSAQILFRPNDIPVVVAMQRDLPAAQVAIRVSNGGQVLSESTANFPEATMADLLAQELGRDRRDADYESALRFATQLI
jgi:glucose-6-phosphate dehydrogenase assembly protein OpcA